MSESRELRIRPADGEADIDGAADVLLRAFAGQQNARLGRGYARALMHSFALGPSRCLLVAVAENRICGIAAGELSESRGSRYASLRPAAARAMILRPWLLIDPDILRMTASRLRGGADEAVPDGTWFLALLGVDPLMRKQGVGRLLLESWEAEGRRRGFADATLFVQASNLAARSMYDGAGWTAMRTERRGRILYSLGLTSRGT